jgi:hypothetical protein
MNRGGTVAVYLLEDNDALRHRWAEWVLRIRRKRRKELIQVWILAIA